MVHQKMKQVRHIPNKSIANLSMSITFVTYSVMGMKRYETVGDDIVTIETNMTTTQTPTATNFITNDVKTKLTL